MTQAFRYDYEQRERDVSPASSDLHESATRIAWPFHATSVG